jgi:hypothetical protein
VAAAPGRRVRLSDDEVRAVIPCPWESRGAQYRSPHPDCVQPMQERLLSSKDTRSPRDSLNLAYRSAAFSTVRRWAQARGVALEMASGLEWDQASVRAWDRAAVEELAAERINSEGR